MSDIIHMESLRGKYIGQKQDYDMLRHRLTVVLLLARELDTLNDLALRAAISNSIARTVFLMQEHITNLSNHFTNLER